MPSASTADGGGVLLNFKGPEELSMALISNQFRCA
jgi:hypothetical protein